MECRASPLGRVLTVCVPYQGGRLYGLAGWEIMVVGECIQGCLVRITPAYLVISQINSVKLGVETSLLVKVVDYCCFFLIFK